MPEGDTIFRAATQLRKVLVQKTIVRASGRWEIPDAESLSGQPVDGIEARGKHLLIHFGDRRVVHSHMGMTGSWHIYRHGEAWQKSERAAALVLQTERFVVVCFSPKLIELVSATCLRRNEYLNRLGPDLLGPTPDADMVLRRFRSQNPLSIGEVVMNQTVVCGIGNVYKSEVLFLERLHPLVPVGSMTDDKIAAVVQQAIDLMKRNLKGYPRTTRFAAGENVWVYGRRGKECFECGSDIDMIRQGALARSTYFCPSCQPVPAAPKPLRESRSS
jgi:endonuclease-8